MHKAHVSRGLHTSFNKNSKGMKNRYEYRWYICQDNFVFSDVQRRSFFKPAEVEQLTSKNEKAFLSFVGVNITTSFTFNIITVIISRFGRWGQKHIFFIQNPKSFSLSSTMKRSRLDIFGVWECQQQIFSIFNIF